MEDISVCFTVYFDGRHWIGLYERRNGGRKATAKYLFKSEPKEADIFNLITKGRHKLYYYPKVKALKKRLNL